MGVKFSRFSSGRYHFNCPGCLCGHWVNTNPVEKPCWTFNEDLTRPTLMPSLRIDYGPKDICHFFIKDGFFEFCTDSTHALSGQRVEIPDWDD